MLRNIFLKTIFEKRLSLLLWFIAITVSNILLVQLFPPIKEAFADMMNDIPASLQGWFGESEIWSTLTGYVSMEIMGQMSLIVIIFSIVFSTSIFASEEASGSLLTQLARPIRRQSYFLQKYLALVFSIILISVGFWLGIVIGTAILGEPMSPIDLAPSMLAIFLIALSFASITFSIGAITGTKSLPGIIVGFYVALGYLITSMSSSAEILSHLSKLTPFYYYNTPYVLIDGLVLKNVLILIAISIVPICISLPIFTRRNLKTK